MNRFAASLFYLVCLFVSAPSFSQSFNPGTVNVNGVKKTEDQILNLQQSSGNENIQKSTSATDDLLTKPASKNFSGYVEKEKDYDNSLGKVAHFRIVDDKIVFDDERRILVYYDNYKVEKAMDGIVRCSMRIYVLNDLEERISNIGMKLKWPEISTNVQMSKVNPGVRTYMDIMLLGDGCLSMDKAPTIEVNRCRVKGMSEDKCSDAIRWFNKNQ